MVLKTVHVFTVLVTLLLFVVRAAGRLRAAAWVRNRWLRITPHVNDSVLLFSAIGLTVQTGQYPFLQGWLTAKVLGLTGYIALGAFALGEGRRRTARIVAAAAALLLFAYIFSVALTKSPWGMLHSVGSA